MDPELLAELPGLVACAIGVLYMVNALVLPRPRGALIEEYFGVERPASLEDICRSLERRVQGIAGAVFLLAGFALMLGWKWVEHPGRWTVGLLAAAVAGIWIAAKYTRASLRRYLREFFAEHPWSFEEHIDTTKEVGAALGLASLPDETVDAYVDRLRSALDLEPGVPARPVRN